MRLHFHYSAGAISNVVKRTLTQRRVERLPRKPFQVSELIGPLAKDEPVAIDTRKALRDWYQETVPMCKKEEDPNAPKKDDKKGGGKKKK